MTVFQDYALFPHMNVRQNGIRAVDAPRSERERIEQAEKALESSALSGFGDRKVHQISGGQRQRVALARAIVIKPAVLLLDEPLGALDVKIRRQMQDELRQLQRRLGATFIHVTHDQEEAMSIADTILLLNKGRIEDVGPPERIYRKPASLFAATFMGEANLVQGRISRTVNGSVSIDTSLRVNIPAAGAGSSAGACTSRSAPSASAWESQRMDPGFARQGHAERVRFPRHASDGARRRSATDGNRLLLRLPPELNCTGFEPCFGFLPRHHAHQRGQHLNRTISQTVQQSVRTCARPRRDCAALRVYVRTLFSETALSLFAEGGLSRRYDPEDRQATAHQALADLLLLREQGEAFPFGAAARAGDADGGI